MLLFVVVVEVVVFTYTYILDFDYIISTWIDNKINDKNEVRQVQLGILYILFFIWKKIFTNNINRIYAKIFFPSNNFFIIYASGKIKCHWIFFFDLYFDNKATYTLEIIWFNSFIRIYTLSNEFFVFSKSTIIKFYFNFCFKFCKGKNYFSIIEFEVRWSFNLILSYIKSAINFD